MAPYCDRVDLTAFCGRWVRSDTKVDNWESYTMCFGMNEDEVRQETIEPEIHIITSMSKEQMTIVHQRPWLSGAQTEYSVPLDGTQQEIPHGLLRVSRSSWQVSERALWRHTWDENGLMCELRAFDQGQERVLRYWRSLLSANEIQMTLRVFDLRGGEEVEVAHAARHFDRAPFRERWTAAAAQFFSGANVEANLQLCVKWMKAAKEKGADLVVLPENSNRDRDYFVEGKPSRERCYQHSETLDGAFVAGLKTACRELRIWACVGVDLRGDAPPTVHIAQLLIRPDGELHGVTKKHVLWDYEYTLFTPGSEPYQVFDTELGRLAMLCCADGIVPEAARVLALMGAQVLLNSLNSRGPDEMRVHIPLRAIENGVWHVAANAVGNPKSDGLLWPWTGGSEVCSPAGARVVASEEDEDMVVADVRPFEAERKASTWSADLFAVRRPELYAELTRQLEAVPAAPMYGPAPAPGVALPFDGPDKVTVAMMQLSFVHTRKCTEWMTRRQVKYAKKRGADIGVLPELWCFRRGEVAADPQEAASYSAKCLGLMLDAAKEEHIHLCFSLVEEPIVGESYFHTAYLVGPGGVVAKYRKAHIDKNEQWATPCNSPFEVHATPLGRIALMVGSEVWIPEMSRCLALKGAEIVLHPADWDSKEAGDLAATERAGENRFHLVSVTRLDCPGVFGSQTTLAGEYLGDEPIPLMRYAQGVWARHNVEEQILVDLPRRQAHCKMMGDNLDVLRKRFPELYGIFTEPQTLLPTWRNTTRTLPGDYADGYHCHWRVTGSKRKYDPMVGS